MGKGKTEYRFTINADMAVVNNVIQNYLAVNEFHQEPRQNANYYFFNDPIVKGKRGFEYYINGNEVVILAYIGTFEKPMALEGAVGAIPKQSYKNDLNPLFTELKKLEAQGQDAGAVPPQNQSVYQSAPADNAAANSINTFVEQSNKKKDTWTIVGFVISLLGLLFSFFGMSYGIVLLILEFYCGIQGIHSKKKGLAIATIVIACVSILILLIEVVFSVLA
ncbi:MAG: hypothetical protein PUB28_00725 [Roseburia sp.]|nr:hypothetical protein [Roseburia sp.]